MWDIDMLQCFIKYMEVLYLKQPCMLLGSIACSLLMHHFARVRIGFVKFFSENGKFLHTNFFLSLIGQFIWAVI